MSAEITGHTLAPPTYIRKTYNKGALYRFHLLSVITSECRVSGSCLFELNEKPVYKF